MLGLSFCQRRATDLLHVLDEGMLCLISQQAPVVGFHASSHDESQRGLWTSLTMRDQPLPMDRSPKRGALSRSKVDSLSAAIADLARRRATRNVSPISCLKASLLWVAVCGTELRTPTQVE